MSNDKLQQFMKELDGKILSDETMLKAEMFDDENSVICIKVEDREEFPIYMTVDEGQILCTVHLFGEDQVDPGQRSEMIEDMLMLNISIPLSAFSKVGSQYVMFGALSPSSSIEDLLHEIEMLSDNVLEAIDAISDYLKEAA
ncbi:hypothetical protein MNBD_GAMMA07-200 [hydrothermal vent metagenome]|uniref:DUF2170 domain-containing protein n=1 Tax=hydrothermal vent metagenome TaxID=652676 RepID=A0A3B0XJ50_9ZZZZ